MNRACMWTGALLSLLFCTAPQVHAGGYGFGGAVGGGFGGFGGFGGHQFGNNAGGLTGGYAGVVPGGSGFGGGFHPPGGMIGMGGFCGFGGCLGGFPCQFGGCFGGCLGGSCGFSGFNVAAQQFYGAWNKFPGRSYYHRDLQVTQFTSQSLTVIHYPDRPSYFYFYDPAQKKYVGRYRRGAKDQDCFSMIAPNARKATLGEVAEKSYMKWGPMPSYAQLTSPAAATPNVPVAATPQLVRPPDTLPGHDLPPDEFLEKEK